MLFSHIKYPVAPLPPVPSIYLQAILAEQAVERDPDSFDEEAKQHAYIMLDGAERAAMERGGKASHADQAAALLAIWRQLDLFLDGHWTVGGSDRFDLDEKAALASIRDAISGLMRWHFANGAGALLPHRGRVRLGSGRVQVKALLAQPFMGTDLTVGGAVAIFMAGPAFWLVAAVAWAALPA